MVSVTFRCSAVYGIEHLLYLGVAESGNDLPGRLRDLYAVKGITAHNIFGDKPGEKYPQAAQIAIYGVSGKIPFLGMVKAVVRKAFFMLQIEDEGAYLMLAYLSCIRTLLLRVQEVLEVVHAAADNGDGIWAFTLGGGAQPVTLQQGSDIGAKI